MPSRSLNIRIDDEVDAAIARLRQSAGAVSASEVVRRAILDADRARLREQMRADAAALMADPDEVAETMRVNAEMDEHRAW
ncbi:MAG: ribbon-helix-helix protein, CopG family [Sporichthyaceae bacterium]